MAVVGATPGVVAAFTFGILTNAATAALFLYYRSHGSSIFRDGLRLVLIIFLLSSALWAQIDFISVLLDVSSRSVMPCQITTIFATIFDQLARFSIEQYLLWAMNDGAAKVSAGTLIPQLLILARLVAGGVFAGFTRAQTDTFCVATSSVLPVALVVIIMDVVILVLLIVRAFQTGVVGSMKKAGSDAHRSKSILFVMLGFAIWTGMSVMMLLGMRSVDVAARTAVPAVGLTILIIAVTASVETLRAPRTSGSQPPEAPSPRRINISRDITTADSEYPPSRYEDLKEATMRSSTTFVNPRQVPMFKDETDPGGLPRIARPVTGISGVGGLPVQGELFPPPRSMTAVSSVVSSAVGPDKKRMFGRSNTLTGGKLVIGAPVLQSRDGPNPLSKMPLMDLKEAAQQEKDRREKMAETGMSANWATVRMSQNTNVSSEEGLKRAVSLRRKEVQSMASHIEKFPETLQPKSAGMTTSAQLSPAGVDDSVRRRSPRQTEIPMPVALNENFLTTATSSPRLRSLLPDQAEFSFAPDPEPQPASMPRPGSLLPEQAAHALTTAPVPAPQPVAVPVPVPTTAGLRPAPDATIRPSRRLPSPKSSPPPEPTKTPLQRRPTVGLPSNPRSRGMSVDQHASAAANQTVLFVNKIVYNNPSAVEDIIKGASDQKTKAALAPVPATTPGNADSRLSVVNRPRPIPRKAADPQPSPSPKHRRNKSSGSVVSRKSGILTSMPGSPTALPPLPDLPKSAGAALRPQPNDTKSMTFDEKMTMFFPNPPSGGVTRSASKRRSSVPELPRIPVSYMMADSPTETEEGALSRRTTIKTESILDVDEITEMPAPTRRRAPSVADEVGTSWLPGIAFEPETMDKEMRASQRSEKSTAAGRRASSPVIPIPPIPANRDSDMTFGSIGPTTMDDATTNWGSVHSPEVAVPVVMAGRIAQPTQVQKPGLPGFGAAKKVGNANRQTMTKQPQPQPSMQQEPKTLVTETTPKKPEVTSQWHHRVGDECPKFSTRMQRTKSRKGPPPTPLLLNGSSTKKPVYVQAEPSPMESPGQALHQIQEQLKKLDEPARQDTPQRIALLENLEKEMGLQENHWQEMKHDLARDSLSSVQTSSSPAVQEVKTDSVAAANNADNAPIKSSLADRRASRRALMRMSTSSSRRTSTQSNDNAQLSNWQKRLTEAQMEYMDTAAKMLRDRTSNYLTTSLTMAQLGSPTPPESEQSDDEEEEVELTHESSQITMVMNVHMEMAPEPMPLPVVKTASLWTPTAAPKKRTPSKRLLWSPPAKTTPEPEAQLPSLSVRPAPRKELAPLRIHSTQLWRKPHPAIKRADGGLWRPVWASAAPPVDLSLLSSSSSQGSSSSKIDQASSSSSSSQKAPRPLTQRPPRRNKRVTLLPDILESPKPLPDKRGTLGIFQFPWGEKSDTASVVPTAPRIMAMPGTMASGGPSRDALEARSRQLEAAEYSSSFFDDYDDEEDEELVKAVNSSDDDEDDSDDAFDETTLWEIASLLKTDNVPSKKSMFPPMSDSVISDYMDDLPSDDESSREQSIMIGLAEESREHYFEQSPPVAAESTTLWAIEDERAARPLKCKGNKAPVSVGLWQHPEVCHEMPSKGMFSLDSNRSEFRTTTQEPAAKTMDRSPRAATLKPLEVLSSSGLWTHDSVPKKTRPIWTGGEPKKTPVSKGLWQHPIVRREIPTKGLFTLNSNRTEYRTTSQEPAAKSMERKPRAITLAPLQILPFSGLWTPASVPKKTQPIWTGAPHTRARKISSPRKPKTKSAKIPIPSTTEAEWLAALNEAILASYPDSEEAAEIAFSSASHVRRSRPVFVTPEFDSATRHPVFAASSLVTTSEWFHPAATGYTYDTAIVNPVFFGSLAITCPLESVHPVMACYAAKKLRRQRSKSSVSRSNSRKRREEIKAQIRALEESEFTIPAVPVPETTDRLFMPEASSAAAAAGPAPLDPFIQAQIEALEQERMFVQRLAQEEYARRASIVFAEEKQQQQQVEEVPPVPVLPAVEDLQRRLSRQVHQSLVWRKEETKPVAVVHMRSGSSSSEGSDASGSMMTFTTGSSSTAHQHHAHSNSVASVVSVPEVPSPVKQQRTGYRSAFPTPVFSGPVSLWTPPSKTAPAPPAWQQMPSLSALPASYQLEGIEDRSAQQRREKGRKQIQRLKRRNEILAQIAAIESGTAIVDPRREMLETAKMWSISSLTEQNEEARRKDNKNWLREVNTLGGIREVEEGRHTTGASRVVLRY
ncbi:hypothetical protein V8F20_002390 [Naviculisporaceae sp. PSN 640]